MNWFVMERSRLRGRKFVAIGGSLSQASIGASLKMDERYAQDSRRIGSGIGTAAKLIINGVRQCQLEAVAA